jgi:hypothetical protein
MFAADGLEDTLPQEVRAEFVEGPASVGQTEFVRGRLGQLPDGSDLGPGQACRSTLAAWLTYGIQAVALEGPEVGIGGVTVDFQEAGDVAGRDSSGVQQEGFGAAALPIW